MQDKPIAGMNIKSRIQLKPAGAELFQKARENMAVEMYKNRVLYPNERALAILHYGYQSLYFY